MSIFDRLRNRQVEVPEADVNAREATVTPSTDGEMEDYQPHDAEPSSPRKLKIPKKTWAKPNSTT